VTADPDGKNAKEEVFASGWLEGDQGYLGRPADIVLATDGSILVADDWAGVRPSLHSDRNADIAAEPTQIANLVRSCGGEECGPGNDF